MTKNKEHKRKKVLVVEDDETISLMYKAKLESCGYEIINCCNGADALEIITKELPDLVVLDVMIPLMDGFSVLERMKKNKGTKKIPVILLTNLATDEDIKKGKKMGAADYLVKANLTPTQITEKVKKYIK